MTPLNCQNWPFRPAVKIAVLATGEIFSLMLLPQRDDLGRFSLVTVDEFKAVRWPLFLKHRAPSRFFRDDAGRIFDASQGNALASELLLSYRVESIS